MPRVGAAVSSAAYRTRYDSCCSKVMNGPGQAASTRTVLLTVVIVVAVLRLAQEVFIPLALAILFTFLLAPLVARLTRLGINRLVAVVVSVAVALTLVGVLADV